MGSVVSSSVEICNLAIADLGGKTLTNITDDSKEGRFCNRRYANLRDSVLRAHPWNFATKRVELARSTTDPVFKYAYAHTLPSDFLRLLGTNEDSTDFEYKIENGVIASDAGSLKIKYIFRQENVNRYDSLFVEALAARIAAALSYPLTGDRNLSHSFWEEYKNKVSEAWSADGMEGSPDRLIADEWIEARLSGVDSYRPIDTGV